MGKKAKIKRLKRRKRITRLIALAVVIIGLALILSGLHKQNQRKSRDAERKSDLSILQAKLEDYRDKKGFYPSLSQLNDSNFRNSNLAPLDQSILRDPRWNSSNRSCSVGGTVIFQASTPASGCYAYTPTPAGCDNSAGGNCLDYSLSVVLEADGSVYTKQSITN